MKIQEPDEKVATRIHRWVENALFLAIHAGVILVFFVPFRWSLVALCLGLYFVRMFAITAGFHRYFAHRSYRMSRVPQFVMAFLGTMALQRGPLWWAGHHRHHHRFSDLPQDLHSPIQSGLWHSHVGWVLCGKHDKTPLESIQDFAKFPELRFLDRHYWAPGALLGVVLFLVGGWAAFVWGFLVSTVLLYHATFAINSIAHLVGSRRYHTTDTSRNHLGLALLTLGEGWHNNHHAYMSSTRQGFFWWEIDISYYCLKGLEQIGIVSQLRQPPLQLLEARRIRGSTHDPDGASAA